MSKRLRKRLRLGAAVVVIALAGIQFVPVDRSNPPVTMSVQAPPDVLSILRRSCFDCHSHETHWPWYSYVAPVSWLVAKDVRDGRDHLNFSTWDAYPPADRFDVLDEIWEEASEGEMPLSIYLLMHPDAGLSADDLAVLRGWTYTAGEPGRGREAGRFDRDEREEHEDHDEDD